jgi:uncharacterized protein
VELLLGALLLGVFFGLIAELSGFCTMGAIADATAFGDWTRARSWMLAVCVALLGTEALRWICRFDPLGSIYLSSELSWAGALVGGGLLGFGMVLAGGCVSRNLVRFGAGDLRSGVTLMVLGVFAYMTLHGLIAPARVALERATDLRLQAFGYRSQGLPELAPWIAGSSTIQTRSIWVVSVGVLLAAVCFRSRDFRSSVRGVWGGVGVGMAVVAGWWISAVVGFDEFEPTRPTSLTFTAPVGNALIYAMAFTGAKLDFGICTVAGTVIGAAISAGGRGAWRLQGFADLTDLLRNLVGAALMGIGGVVAFGCTIGQGITGLSTMALGSVLATVGVVGGGFAGVRFLERSQS